LTENKPFWTKTRIVIDLEIRAVLSFVRPLLLALIVSGMAAEAASAAPVTQTATVKVTVNKALTLTAVQNMDLGTLTLAGGTWGDTIVGVSRTGALSCGNTNVVCSGTRQVARFNVSGQNQQVVTIAAPDVTLTNQADATKQLTMTIDRPPSITLTNSGSPGMNFDLGGSITVNSTTADGIYTGTMNVTVDYQ
jgi:hypothetical protein